MMTLRLDEWDDQKACIKEAIRLGFTARMGYHAWIAGQGANGYESVLSFFDDLSYQFSEWKKLTEVR